LVSADAQVLSILAYRPRCLELDGRLERESLYRLLEDPHPTALEYNKPSTRKSESTGHSVETDSEERLLLEPSEFRKIPDQHVIPEAGE
jgi:hypothetical protein